MATGRLSWFFGGGALVAAPLSAAVDGTLQDCDYPTGVEPTFITMGVLLLSCVQLLGAMAVRLPAMRL